MLKLVKESINFERTGDVKSSLNIGLIPSLIQKAINDEDLSNVLSNKTKENFENLYRKLKGKLSLDDIEEQIADISDELDIGFALNFFSEETVDKLFWAYKLLGPKYIYADIIFIENYDIPGDLNYAPLHLIASFIKEVEVDMLKPSLEVLDVEENDDFVGILALDYDN